MAPDRCDQHYEDGFVHAPFVDAADLEPAHLIVNVAHVSKTRRPTGLAKHVSLLKDERYDSEPAYTRSGPTYAVAQSAQPERSGSAVRKGRLSKDGGMDSLNGSGKERGHDSNAGVKGVMAQGRKKKAVALSENDFGRRIDVRAEGRAPTGFWPLTAPS